jgi:hypothetical protein
VHQLTWAALKVNLNYVESLILSPLSCKFDGSVQGPLIPNKKGKSLDTRKEFFLFLVVGGVREDPVLLAYFIAILQIIKKRL